MMQTVLLILIGVLLIVVFLPVAVAMVQRILREGGKRGTPAAPPPAKRPVKIPPMQPVPLDAPPPTPKAVPSKRGTTDEVLDTDRRPRKEPSLGPAGTEMMQWHGMLLCTEGPLQGQVFVIEDDGFYIGREPELSKVVINDGRISKRHVRVIPRDDGVYAIDQESTNGTFLSSAPQQRITEVALNRGDELILGDNVVTFRYQI